MTAFFKFLEVETMCGIAGQIGYQQDLRQRTEPALAMQAALRRRGPDQEGIYAAEHALLAHTRLCVIDPENGRQPMTARQGNRRCTLVYNGELYNTEELRAELLAAGWSFSGHSDTEVLLKSYMEWGEDCVERFNGIFAFAVWEETAETLFLARDRMGVKPLFYTLLPDGDLLFASELKALLAHPDVPAEIDDEGVAELILIGPGRTPGCGVFRNLRELLPGQCGTVSRDGLRLRKYWSLTAREHTDDRETTIERVRFLVEDSIRRQLVADVPLGTFLSGGLDSSIISSVANRAFREKGETLRTFSVDYRDNDRYFVAGKFQPSGDNPYIAKMSEFLGCPHTDVVLDTLPLTDALDLAAEARDLPGMADVDSSLLLFCRAVRRQVTVAVSGECADEIFGGYPWFRDKSVRPENGFPWAQSTAYRASFLTPEYAAKLDAEEIVRQRYRRTLHQTDCLPSDTEEQRRARMLMKLNMDWFMQTLLDRKDRMSMWSALEVRVPYCDYRIAEYLYNVPAELRDLGGQEKGLLRAAMRDWLPEEVLRRKKSPYPKTVHPAYLREVSERLRHLLDAGDSPLFAFVRKDALAGLLERNDAQPWYGQLMTTPQTIAYFLQMDHWMRTYRVHLAG